MTKGTAYEETYTSNLLKNAENPQRWDVEHLRHLSNQWIRFDASSNLWVSSDSHREPWKQWEVDVRLMSQITPRVKVIAVSLGYPTYITTRKTPQTLCCGVFFVEMGQSEKRFVKRWVSGDVSLRCIEKSEWSVWIFTGKNNSPYLTFSYAARNARNQYICSNAGRAQTQPCLLKC